MSGHFLFWALILVFPFAAGGGISGVFTGWLLVCTRAAGRALLPPGLGEKAVTAPAVTQSPGWLLHGPGVASPAIAPFVLHLIKFSVGSGSVKQFGDVIPLIANKPLLDCVRCELQGLTPGNQEMRTANKEPRW